MIVSILLFFILPISFVVLETNLYKYDAQKRDVSLTYNITDEEIKIKITPKTTIKNLKIKIIFYGESNDYLPAPQYEDTKTIANAKKGTPIEYSFNTNTIKAKLEYSNFDKAEVKLISGKTTKN